MNLKLNTSQQLSKSRVASSSAKEPLLHTNETSELVVVADNDDEKW